MSAKIERTLSGLYHEYLQLSLQERHKILNNAIDYMEQSNTRTKSECICLAMGYESDDGETWTKRGK